MPSVSSALIAALMTAGSFTPVLTLQDPAIDESSGLTRSAVHENGLWTHNDGGTVADVIGVDERGRDV
ncbi:MAG: WD40 repeat domain-containing protein, partial [Actinomycetes bacterium]